MRKILLALIVSTIIILGLVQLTHAQITVPQGGTGSSTVASGQLLWGDTALRLGSSINLKWDKVWNRLIVSNLAVTSSTSTNATTTNLAATTASTTDLNVSKSLTIQVLTGVLQAINGLVSSTSTISENFIDANIARDSELHSSVTVTDSNTVDLTLVGQDLTADGLYTAGDGLTLTTADFDCDTASGSVFGCLLSTDWTIFNNKVSSSSLPTSQANPLWWNGTVIAPTSTPTFAAFHATSTTASSTAGVISLSKIVTSATSTGTNGFDISAGCFAINGVCVGGSDNGTVSSGLAGQLAYYASDGTTVSGTTTGVITAGRFTATTSVASILPYASSTHISVSNGLTVTGGRLGVGNSNPSYALDVTGDIRTLDGSLKIQDTTNGLISISDNGLRSFELGVSSNSDYNFSFINYADGVLKVGIGTTTLADKLTIEEGNLRFNYAQSNGTDGTFGYIDWAQTMGSAESVARIEAVRYPGSWDYAGLRFFTANGTIAERMRISDVGSVGIGTTSPSANYKLSIGGGNLHIGGFITSTSTAASRLPYASSTSITVSGTAYILPLSGSAEAIALSTGYTGANYKNNIYTSVNTGTNSSNYLRFDISNSAGASSEVMRINGDGRVGIGTTTPGSRLAIQGNLQVVGPSVIGGGIATMLNGSSTKISNGAYGASDSGGTGADVYIANGGNAANGGDSGGAAGDIFLAQGGEEEVAGVGTDGDDGNVYIGSHLTNIRNAVFNLFGGMRIDTASTTAFRIVNGATPIITVDSTNSRLGIGTSTPGNILSLGNTGIQTINFRVNATSTFASSTNLTSGCYAIGGSCVGVTEYRAWSMAPTTTAWTATTTDMFLSSAPTNENWEWAECSTNAGTLDIVVSDGTNFFNYMIGVSSTPSHFTFSTNNSFSAGEKRFIRAGNPASSPSYFGCSFKLNVPQQ